MTGSSLTTTGPIEVGVATGSTGVLNISGGNVFTTDLKVGNGTVTIGNGNTLNASSAVLNSAGAGVINVGQGGALATLASGAGVVVVDTIQLNNGAVTAATNVTIETALTGNGTITGNTVLGAGSSLSPGLSAGEIIFGNNLTLNATGTLNIEIGGSTPITNFDKVSVTNILNAGGTLQVSLINGFVPTVGQAFDILDFVGTSGTFTSVPSPANWDTTDLLTLGVVKFVALGSGSGIEGGAVPEPTTLALIALAGMALIGRRPPRRTGV
jgi:hypothetical protein